MEDCATGREGAVHAGRSVGKPTREVRKVNMSQQRRQYGMKCFVPISISHLQYACKVADYLVAIKSVAITLNWIMAKAIHYLICITKHALTCKPLLFTKSVPMAINNTETSSFFYG